jgi:aminoglycoside phosphotransferase (APT) family kinase protein
VGNRLGRLITADPGPLAPVPCHGDFTPVTVLLDPDDHRELAITGWSSALVSDREYDVAFTELGLWSSPYLTPDRERRPMLKVARSFLVNGYRAGYAAVAGAPDPERLRLWGAHHVCRVLAGPLLTAEPYRSWDPDVAATTVTAFRAELLARFDDLLPDLP